MDFFVFDFCLWFGILRLPVFTTRQTRDKYRGRFIRTSCLQLIICAFFRLAFAARKHIRRCMYIIRIFTRIAHDFLINKCPPMCRIHFLVCHKRECHRCNVFVSYLIHQFRIFQIYIDCPQSIRIQLHKQRVLPFFQNFSEIRLFYTIIINGLF